MSQSQERKAASHKVTAIFALSGASALIYQIIWARWFGLVFGNTTLSISIVLGSFMSGLALGSWFAGRALVRIKDPMRVYIAMELGIGAFALVSPAIFQLTDLLFTMLVSAESSGSYGIAVKTILSFLVLLVPTTLMGTTLPLLTEYFHRTNEDSESWHVGILYSANTIGAAVGILAASFFLIELIGVRSTTFLAAALNFVVALLALKIASTSKLSPAMPAKELPFQVRGGARVALGVVAYTGAMALASEILWTRIFETLVGNSTYAFASIVLLYLVGIALGSAAMSMHVNRLRKPLLWLSGLVAFMGLWTLLSVEFFKYFAVMNTNFSINMVPIRTLLLHYLEPMGALTPLAFFSGACFPLVTRILDRDSNSASGALVAKAYAWNTIGAVAGSLLAGFIIAPFFDFLNALYIVSAFYFFCAAAVLILMTFHRLEPGQQTSSSTFLGAVSAFFGVICLLLAASPSYFVARLEALGGKRKVAMHRSGLQGVTTVIQDPANYKIDLLLVNGMGMTVKATDTKMMAHFPLLLHPNPENTLVICLGMGTTFRSAVSHGKRVTVVEIVKEVADALPLFYQDSDAFKTLNGSKIVVNDGRNYLKVTHEKFDVITLDPPPPIDAAGVNNLYSKDFIELARSHLNKGGIMAHWIPFPGTASGVDDIETLDALIVTFAQEFPYVLIHRSLNGIGLHVLGSMEPLVINPAEIIARAARKSVSDDLNEWDHPTNEWLSQGWEAPDPKSMLNSEIITDDSPYLEFYLLRTLRSDGKKMLPMVFW